MTISGSGATFSLSSAGVLTISGIANASLTSSSITIGNAGAISLGGSASLDSITGLAATGLVKRTGTNALAIAVADTDYVTPSGTGTLSNKRIAPRATTITSSATPTVNTDNFDFVDITALAVNITSMTSGLTGTPNNFERMVYRIKDNGTARTIIWGAAFASSMALLPTTTIAGKVITVGLMRDTTKGTWECVAVDIEDAAFASLQTTATAPTGTTSLASVMAGLGAAGAVITPRVSGKLHVTITGNMGNNTASSGAAAVVAYGTGAAPANGAATTGTSIGSTVAKSASGGAANESIPFSASVVITGLTIGTQVWLDLVQAAVVGGIASLTSVTIAAYELP